MSQPGAKTPRVGAMAIIAAALGVLMVGAALPFAALVGSMSSTVAEAMDHLPANFETGTLPLTTKIVDAHGQLIANLYAQNRIYMPITKISPKMSTAIVGIEDARFFQHGALDIQGTLRAFIRNTASNGAVQGGSSITQQLVKLTLLNEARTPQQRADAIADTYTRKLKELRYAIALERTHSKQWILERYLNTAYFGDGAFGVEAAARHYFGISSSKLNWPQAALLAGLVKNPTGFNPAVYPTAAKERRDIVLHQLGVLHVITSDLATHLEKQSLGLDIHPVGNGCVGSPAEFFCAYVVRYLQNDPALGATPAARLKLLQSGGLTIHTTVDLRFQAAADASVHRHVYATDNAIGALAMLEPGTGYVRAIAQSRPMGAKASKGQTFLNYAVPTKYGDSAGFQAGSTFKLFVLSSALMQGFALSTTFNALPSMTFPNSAFNDCPGDGLFSGSHTWNNSTISGRMNAYVGTRESVNTYFAQLEQKTGLCAPYKLAQKMGVTLTDPPTQRVPTFTLGVDSTDPLSMAEAYATVAARGLHCSALPVTEIDDSTGAVVKKYDPKCEQVMPQGVADAVNDVLRGLQQPGGFGYANNLQLKIPSAAKTGTNEANMSVWYDGYTPHLATVSMIAGAAGNGDWLTLNGQRLGGTYVATAHGSTTAGPMWGDAMKVIQQWLPSTDFVKPPANLVSGSPVVQPTTTAIPGMIEPDVTGLTYDSAQSILSGAGYPVVRGPSVLSDYPAGTVVAQSPASGAPSGTVITLTVSAGQAPPSPPPTTTPPTPTGSPTRKHRH
ncbi:penicillin-binding protein [Nocardioides baekrokdamisoli]|uniref:Penicillin-binding protein n=1 Tax=Nocardioides baekrokdamisoli TaxID=1804624 RepID=A0A3G9J3U5_9ACTN|nr:penicillin-binding protein [Nocardioides baekrokdamisoli]BBH17679.1 penicillin-binding protein [Nocardioides baekrokdamisoli]